MCTCVCVCVCVCVCETVHENVHGTTLMTCKFSQLLDKEPVRVAGTKRKRDSTPVLDELEDYEEEEEEGIEDKESESPPPKVAKVAAPVMREEEGGEKRERGEEEREGERGREEEGSPTRKVIKMGGHEGEESRSRGQRSSAIAKKVIKVLQVRRSLHVFVSTAMSITFKTHVCSHLAVF